MKASTIRTVCCPLILAFGYLPFCTAQGCGVVMTPNFSTYETESNDGTHIYTSVLIDGSASCTTTPECPCNTALHTPKALNHLGSTGGWGSGQSGCANCYLSYKNNQSVATGPDVNFSFEGSGEVQCSIAGTFFDQTFANLILALKVTYWGPPVTDMNDTCYWGSLACTGGTKPTCNKGTGVTFVPNCPQYVKATWIVVSFVCVPVPFVEAATGPGPCD